MHMTPRTLRLRQVSSAVFGLSFALLSSSLVVVWFLTGEASALRMGVAGVVLFGALALYRVQFLRRAFGRQEGEAPPDRPDERARAERQTWLVLTVVILVAMVPSLLSWPLGGSPVPTLFTVPAMAGIVAALLVRRRALAAELASRQPTTAETT